MGKVSEEMRDEVWAMRRAVLAKREGESLGQSCAETLAGRAGAVWGMHEGRHGCKAKEMWMVSEKADARVRQARGLHEASTLDPKHSSVVWLAL